MDMKQKEHEKAIFANDGDMCADIGINIHVSDLSFQRFR